MKKLLIPMLALGGALSLQPALAADGEALFKSKPCVACHNADAKMVGPALKEIAAKNAGNADAAATRAASIKNGSNGKWDPIPMPPNVVTEDEAKTLATWILGLK